MTLLLVQSVVFSMYLQPQYQQLLLDPNITKDIMYYHDHIITTVLQKTAAI